MKCQFFYTEENLQGEFYPKKSAKIATIFAHKSKKTMKKDDFDIRFIYSGRVFGGILPFHVDFDDGQFSEGCNVDGSFFDSDAIPIILFGKA